jgi:hypothetical protein
LKIWTLPALGRTGAGSWPNIEKEHAAATANAANFCMGTILVAACTYSVLLVSIMVQIFEEW